MAKNQYILGLNELGQSIWLDFVSKKILDNGELSALINDGVSGLTSNPTIFKNAIADSSDYDNDMKPLAKNKLNAEQICEELMMKDVGRAADALSDVYKKTDAGDGYASIEVSPFLARDTKTSTDSARRLWKTLNRPNIMIKIPGTPEGLPAIRTLLSEGINVNVTLIFSGEVYQQVAETYISALEERMAKGLDISKVSSVASFFVSRVDSICEKKFDELLKAGKVKDGDQNAFFGKIGIANSKLAYVKFEELFNSPRFKKLEAKGARVQRPLWASTGTKNPKLSSVLYIEELAGRHTVNTLPPATLKALMQGATIEPRLHKGADAAKKVFDDSNRLGLEVAKRLEELQVQGVKLFSDAYQELLDSVEKKRASLAA